VNVIVCVKYVPDPNIAKFNLKTKTVEEFFYIINPYDKVAVEEALRLRENVGRGEVTVITVGPSNSSDLKDVLRDLEKENGMAGST